MARWARSGFTLVEILVAFILLTVALLVLAAATVSLARLERRFDARERLRREASSALELQLGGPQQDGEPVAPAVQVERVRRPDGLISVRAIARDAVGDRPLADTLATLQGDVLTP